MGFSEFLGNERIVTALRGALRTERVPHALLFTGPRGVGKFTLARMFAQAANCQRLRDDFCGECDPCRKIGQLANLRPLVEQGLAQRGERPDSATVERVPLLLETHPDVWAIVPDPVRPKDPVARPVLHVGQLRAVQRPGAAMGLDLNAVAKLHRDALTILERAVELRGVSDLFASTAALAKSQEIAFENVLEVFYSLLTDLLDLSNSSTKKVLRNPALRS